MCQEEPKITKEDIINAVKRLKANASDKPLTDEEALMILTVLKRHEHLINEAPE